MRTEIEKRIHDTMKEAIEESQVMGVNLLVEKDGEEIFYGQEGYRDRENNLPMERDTIFRLYSQTKPLTAAAAMILVERGKLDLYQPVSDFLPSYEKVMVAEGENLVAPTRPMLVLDLFNMTSGLPYPGEEGLPWVKAGEVFEEAVSRLGSEKEMSTRELCEALSSCPLAFSPGSSWMYGTSADVLGAVIEECSGMRFGEFLKKELTGPLGMEDTDFYVPEEKRGRLSKVYGTRRTVEGRAYMEEYTGNNLAISHEMRRPPAYEAGGAGLASTLDDYLKFGHMLLHEGIGDTGQKILSPESVRFFTRGQLLPWQQEAFENNWLGLEGFTYNHLLRICTCPQKGGMLARKGEFGWDGWLGMYFAAFPQEKMILLMGCQKQDSGTFTLTRKLRNIVLSSL